MIRALVCFATVSVFATAAPVTLQKSERLITILGTNDIHGGIEPYPNKDGKAQGGLHLWGGIAKAIRAGLAKKYPGQSGVLTVDAGDQFQGTLLSNYDEGELVFRAMSEIGYDAVVPGNHDYDFGPSGWDIDQSDDKAKRREAFNKIIKTAKFPLISANTFLIDSLNVEVDHDNCRPKDESKEIDWKSAKVPGFLRPYVIKEVAGVRVALIGIDNPHTHGTTTADNVADLCFGQEIEHYTRTREALEGQADVFVLVIHQGNAKTDKDLSPIMEKLTSPRRLVDAVVSGHTHWYYNEKFNGVPAIQSGYGGSSFGRIDLVWDTQKKALVDGKMRSVAGVKIFEKDCDAFAAKNLSADFCVASKGKVAYEGVEFSADQKIAGWIAAARKKIAPLAEQHIGHAHEDLPRDRIRESPLANAMTDVFREASKADVATLNTGGLREVIKKGDVTYEELFKVIPFNNHGVVVGPMTVEKILALLDKSIKTCGTYGALMQSGLRVQFRRDCNGPAVTDGLDPKAKLVRVETLDGTILYDEMAGIPEEAPKRLKVATLDFLAAGGSGFDGFKGEKILSDMGVLREVLVKQFKVKPADWKGGTDGRWKNELPEETVGERSQ